MWRAHVLRTLHAPPQVGFSVELTSVLLYSAALDLNQNRLTVLSCTHPHLSFDFEIKLTNLVLHAPALNPCLFSQAHLPFHTLAHTKFKPFQPSSPHHSYTNLHLIHTQSISHNLSYIQPHRISAREKKKKIFNGPTTPQYNRIYPIDLDHSLPNSREIIQYVLIILNGSNYLVWAQSIIRWLKRHCHLRVYFWWRTQAFCQKRKICWSSLYSPPNIAKYMLLDYFLVFQYLCGLHAEANPQLKTLVRLN